MAASLTSLQIHHSIPHLFQTPLYPFSPKPKHLTLKSQKPNDDGIPTDLVKTLAKFKSRHNFIRVLEVSRKSSHPFAGSRLLLLDTPGNIHSINFHLKLLTNTYFDVFATLPPILPPGPLGILGFGAGSAAKLILSLYPNGVIHGWELDPAVISIGREYFQLSKIERLYDNRLFIHIGDGLSCNVQDGFAGLVVDLFSKGRVVPELRDVETWVKMKGKLREGGRVMVNVGGKCVEAEDGTDGEVVMIETLEAMGKVFGGELSVLELGRNKEDSAIAMTGKLPDLEVWKKGVNKSLRFYVDMWKPYKL